MPDKSLPSKVFKYFYHLIYFKRLQYKQETFVKHLNPNLTVNMLVCSSNDLVPAEIISLLQDTDDQTLDLPDDVVVGSDKDDEKHEIERFDTTANFYHCHLIVF